MEQDFKKEFNTDSPEFIAVSKEYHREFAELLKKYDEHFKDSPLLLQATIATVAYLIYSSSSNLQFANHLIDSSLKGALKEYFQDEKTDKNTDGN